MTAPDYPQGMCATIQPDGTIVDSGTYCASTGGGTTVIIPGAGAWGLQPAPSIWEEIFEPLQLLLLILVAVLLWRRRRRDE